MSEEKRTTEPRLEPCDCIPCPDCGGAGWYAQQVSDTEQEQRQCGTCDYKGRVRTPPESWNPKEREELAKVLKKCQGVPTDELGCYFPFKLEGIAEYLLKAGYHRVPPESEKLMPLDEKELAQLIGKYLDDHRPEILRDGCLGIAKAICQRFGTTKNKDKEENEL